MYELHCRTFNLTYYVLTVISLVTVIKLNCFNSTRETVTISIHCTFVISYYIIFVSVNIFVIFLKSSEIFFNNDFGYEVYP